MRTRVCLCGHPCEHDGADALGRLTDRAAQLAQPRVGWLASSGDVLDHQARVAARVDPVESEGARVLEAGEQSRYSATFAPATPIVSPCAASRVPSAAAST